MASAVRDGSQPVTDGIAILDSVDDAIAGTQARLTRYLAEIATPGKGAGGPG